MEVVLWNSKLCVCLSLCVCRFLLCVILEGVWKSEFYRIEQGETAQENNENILKNFCGRRKEALCEEWKNHGRKIQFRYFFCG